MSKQLNNFPCVCAHSRINHLTKIYTDRTISISCAVIGCPCNDFVPDNLRFLEKKSGSK